MDEFMKRRVQTALTSEALDTIPYIDCATTNMVAKYYGVTKETVNNRYRTHRAELDKKGVMTISSKELEDLLPVGTKFVKTTNRCMNDYYFNNGQHILFHVAHNQIFTREAVAYIGDILLNPVKGRKKSIVPTENAVEENLTKSSFKSIEEKKLCINLAKAFASGDTMKVLAAALNLDTYRIECISNLKKDNEDLVKSNSLTPWTERSSINKIAKTLSDVMEWKPKDVYDKIYYKIIQQYHIPLEERGVSPLIAAVKDSEWPLVYQAITEICEDKCLDIRQVFRRSGVNANGLSIVIGGD